eukprot:GEMP01025068.1.p1 GENE.GEMP01025068.1~~GEMP01025068.1.p1  ORF type:complete len:352 (+),score=50.32 GEMP01025068.1:192-1247(+)
MASQCQGNFPAALFNAQRKSVVCEAAQKQTYQYVWISADCQGFSQNASSSTARRLCQKESKARGDLGKCRKIDIYAADACDIQNPPAMSPPGIKISTRNPNCRDKMKAPQDWCGHQGWPSSADATKIYKSYCNHKSPVDHFLLLDEQCEYPSWHRNLTRGTTLCTEHTEKNCYVFDCDQHLCTASDALGVSLFTTTTTTPGSAFDCLGDTCPDWSKGCNKYKYCETTGPSYLAISTDCINFMGHGKTKDDALASCRARGAKLCTVVDENRKLCPMNVWMIAVFILVLAILLCCFCTCGFVLLRRLYMKDESHEKVIQEERSVHSSSRRKHKPRTNTHATKSHKKKKKKPRE